MNNTLAYIIFGIVMLHLIAGFAWAFIKMSKKPKNKNPNNKTKVNKNNLQT